MANIDPFVIPIPKAFTEDQEVFSWITYTHRFLHDLWQQSGIGVLGVADGGTGADNETDARVNLGLEIGVDVQAYSIYLDEAVTFFTSTDITAAEAETLTDDSDAIGLHNHNKQIAARVAHRT